MANYFVLNSTFKPYSFDELIKPYQIYGQAYKEQEAAYNTLLDNASTWEKLRDTNDINEYKAYSAYLEDLQAASDQLAMHGLSPSTRKDVINMARRYKNEISPIEQDYNKREELDKEWRQLHGKDESWIGGSPRDLSLAQIHKGEYDTKYGVSGYKVEEEAMAATQAASARHYQELEPEIALYNQYIKTGMAQGYNPELANAILNDIENNSQIGSVITSIKRSNNYNEMTPNDKAKFDAYLFNGVFKGLGYKEDINYKENLDLDRAIKRAKLNPTSSTDFSVNGGVGQVPVKPYFDAKVGKLDVETVTNIINVLNNLDAVTTPEELDEMLNSDSLVKNSFLNKMVQSAAFSQTGIVPRNQWGSTNTLPKEYKTNAQVLEELSKKYGLDVSISIDSEGHKVIEGSTEAKMELAKLLNDNITLSKGLVATVEEPQRLVNYMNLTIADNTKLFNHNGGNVTNKEVEDFKTVGKTAPIVRFTPAGDLSVIKDGKEFYISVNTISEAPIINVYSTDGNYTPITPSAAQQRYKNIIAALDNPSLNPDEKTFLFGEASSIAYQIMNALYLGSNDLAKSQSKTISDKEYNQ